MKDGASGFLASVTTAIADRIASMDAGRAGLAGQFVMHI